MEAKLFEIRDSGTFIAAIGVRLIPRPSNPFTSLDADEEISKAESYLLRRIGFGFNPAMINLTRLSDNETHFDAHEWPNRTMHNAHRYILENWHDLKSGAVVDVQAILGETTIPKVSERITNPI